ncbi:MAG: hypothetical protein U0271_37645 [Polyangiaceae bacterium]
MVATALRLSTLALSSLLGCSAAVSGRASTSPTRPEPKTVVAPTTFVVTTRPLSMSLDDAAPLDCDLSRPFRGTLGDKPFTVVLSPKDGLFYGALHFDEEEGSAPSVVTLRDIVPPRADDGAPTGQCSEGVVRATLHLANGVKHGVSVELTPLPKTWPGFYRVTREAEASRDDAQCRVTETGLRIFGGSDADLEARLNRQLQSSYFDGWKKEVETCEDSGTRDLGVAIVSATASILSFYRFVGYDSTSAHPSSDFLEAKTLDLTTGAPLELEDVVTDTQALRDLVSDCLGTYLQIPAGATTFTLGETRAYRCEDEASSSEGRYLWDCPEHADSALWVLTEGGILIANHDNITANRALDGNGPIIPYAVLERARILNHQSAAAHLFQGVRAAADDEPTCSSALEGTELRLWSRAR